MTKETSRCTEETTSWPSFFGLLFVKAYRIHLSGIFGGCCRFHPTCSCYAEEAFSKHSFFKALFLTLRRLLRCHPFSRGGYDPVPGPRRNDVK